VLYLLGVLLIAIYWGLWLGFLTSLASAAALNYLHASPTREFLEGLEDRLSALDGRLRLQSPPGRGTLLIAEIPVRG
jgi:uncharacterized protein DUF4118